MPFQPDFSPTALTHLRGLSAHDRTRVLSEVESQLTNEPLMPTRRRKPMRSNLIATWELRVGNLRVYYDVDDARMLVLIRAVGVKRHNRVFIGGEEVELS